MLKWDGSNIADIINDEKTIIEEGLYPQKKTVYWRISNGKQIDFCIVRQSTSTFACLIDEIKPVFKLEKVGTHWVRYKNKILILHRAKIRDKKIIFEVTLDQIGYHPTLEYEIQKIFTFRELLGISKSFEKSILLRDNILSDTKITPISFYEPNMVPSKNEKVISNKILDKWFKDTTLDDSVKKLLKVKNHEDMGKVMCELRSQLDNVIERVDPTAIMHADEILSRVRSRLQFAL